MRPANPAGKDRDGRRYFRQDSGRDNQAHSGIARTRVRSEPKFTREHGRWTKAREKMGASHLQQLAEPILSLEVAAHRTPEPKDKMFHNRSSEE
jgi:hypothetical protein